MINIAQLLKDAPKGMNLYSPLFGGCKFGYIEDEMFIHVSTEYMDDFKFDELGQLTNIPIGDNIKGECLLFPSKDCRTWEGWSIPKPHYDIANFKPFDKVMVRDDDNECWMPSLFGWFDSGLQDGKFVCETSDWHQCIPFEGNEHLLGTTDMPSEEYINW